MQCLPFLRFFLQHRWQTVDTFLGNLRHDIAGTLADLTKTMSSIRTATVNTKKEEIKLQIKLVNDSVKKRWDKMTYEARQKAKSLIDEANSWREEQLQSLDRQFEDWKSTMRAWRRWIAYAVMFLENGSITEQLMSLKSLSEELPKLQDADCGQPELTYNETFLIELREKFRQLTIGTTEETNSADTANNFGTC